MAKVKGPLFSLGASQKLADTLVYFSWKGLNVVREYVVPANPRTALQTTQRGHLTDIVGKIHAAQASTTHPLTAMDTAAYALWASVVQPATTWFNQAVRNGIDQLVKGLRECVFSGGVTTPDTEQLTVEVWSLGIAPTAGVFRYGTSKTALINSIDSTPVGGSNAAIITGLTTGVKYFWQFVPSEPVTILGTKSGIYSGRPT
ncbi:hypothetical protein ES708_11711 [subsurface metagenome]